MVCARKDFFLNDLEQKLSMTQESLRSLRVIFFDSSGNPVNNFNKKTVIKESPVKNYLVKK